MFKLPAFLEGQELREDWIHLKDTPNFPAAFLEWLGAKLAGKKNQVQNWLLVFREVKNLPKMMAWRMYLFFWYGVILGI